MAHLNLVDQISNEIDNKNCSVRISLDLLKEFDTVDHMILLEKLSHLWD